MNFISDISCEDEEKNEDHEEIDFSSFNFGEAKDNETLPEDSN